MMPTESKTTSTGRKPRRASSKAAISTARQPVHLFQIAYSSKTLSEVEGGYGVLDNTLNPRPDWFEYWPIRSYLLDRELDEEAFYGFFSTRFRSKTNLSHAEVVDFVRRHAEDADVLLFSPQPDMGAFFLNVFEQAELFDLGFVDAFAALLEQIGHSVPLAELVMDVRHVVFSNYFVARPKFWRAWLSINEALFAVCEGPDCALKSRLTQTTTYPGAAQRKVFVQERVASLLLATQPDWRSIPHNPFDMGWSMSVFRGHPQEAYISDALKFAFIERRYPQYLQAYGDIRDRLRVRETDSAAPGETFAPGQIIPVRHSLWDSHLIVESEPHRLRHAQHGTLAHYHLVGDLLVVDWDGYGAELFVRHGDAFRVSTFERDRRGIEAHSPAWLTVGQTRLDVTSVCVALPGGMGDAHLRPGTSDMLVFEATLLRRDYDSTVLPEDCDIVVDLGANIGMTSIYFAQRYPRATIVAVEPARDNFELLALNALKRPGIIPVEAAIAPRDGVLDLQDFSGSGDKMQAWAYRTVDPDSGFGQYRVEAISIPTLMCRHGLGFIDVLKIDIEGAEHALFADNTEHWLPLVKTVLIETRERFVAGTDALVSAVMEQDFLELPSRSECRVFVRRP